MNAVIIAALIAVAFGILGAAGRIGMQRWSNKSWPHETWQGYAVALFLGSIGGWLSFELPVYIPEWNYGRVGAFLLGYWLPDILENVLEGFKPPVG